MTSRLQTPFVGRTDELALLHALREQAAAGRGTFARVVGAAGHGKSTLVAHGADLARESGNLAFVGRALDLPGAPPLWPWVEVGRALAAEVPALAERTRADPHLRWLTSTAEAEQEPGPDERFLQFDAFSALLREAERTAPLFIVIEDLHWADGASLSLLAFLAADIERRRLVLIGTTRDDAATAEVPAATGPRAYEIALGGLSESEVHDLLAALGSDLRDRSEELRAVTGGSPFFVQEVARHLASQGLPGTRSVSGELSIAGVPPTLSQLLQERLGRLAGATRSLLQAAAVVGQQFDLALAANVAGMAPVEALGRLSEAVQAGVVIERRDRTGGFEFKHALFMYTLYHGLSPMERALAHGRAGKAIEALYPAETESRVSELARHFQEAAILGDSGRATAYLEQAARRAARLGAPEDAARWFSDAAELVAQDGGDQRRRLGLLLEAARANGLAGNAKEARRISAVVAEAARAAANGPGRPAAGELMAGAALAFGPVWLPTGSFLPEHVALLDEALAALPPDDTRYLPQLLSRRASALHETIDARARYALTSEALAVARTSLSGADLLEVLVTHLSMLWDYQDREERLELIDEALRLAGAERYDLEIDRRRVIGHLEVGDLDAFERELEVLTARAAAWNRPMMRWRCLALRSTAAMVRGELPKALDLAAEAYAYGRRLPGNPARDVYSTQLFNAAIVREEYAGLEAMILASIANQPGQPFWKFMHAFIQSLTGETAAAGALLDEYAADEFARVRIGGFWLGSLSQLAEMCVLAGATRHAPALYRLIEPYAGAAVIDGVGWVFRGSASHYLGRLAALMAPAAPEQWDAAEEHFAAAAAFERSMGARLALARTLAESAAALHARAGAVGGPAAAGWLATANLRAREAREIAGELGLGPLQERSAYLLERVASARKALRGGPSVRADGLTPRELDVLRLIAQGRSNGEIAAALVLSEGTTRQYVSGILSKIGAKSRAEAAVYAHRNGIVPGH